MGAIVQNGLLTLGELRRAAGCLETVLLFHTAYKVPTYKGFRGHGHNFNP